MSANIILCADDFALTEGVSTGILELAGEKLLSATGALVTGPHWQPHAVALRASRDRLAAGLHFNLTLGKPLGAMPWLCPIGTFPTIATVIRACLSGHIQGAEIERELGRQLDAFEQEMGHAPDFVDGHQHVHALPTIRGLVLGVLKQRYDSRKLLVRDPGDSPGAILARGAAVKKALLLATLARGFGDAIRTSGFIANSSFSGVSAFDEKKSYRAELDRFFKQASACHLVMCHPGYVDDELPTLDPVVRRRADELAALKSYPQLPDLIWHPVRAPDGSLDWPGAGND